MKKLFILVSLIIVTACSGGSNTSISAMIDPGSAPVPKNAKYIIKTAHSAVPDPTHPHHSTMIYFKQNVENITKGEVGVEIYPLASLGVGTSLLPLLENGTIGVLFEANRIFSGFFPETQVLDIPFLIPYPSDAIASQLLDSKSLAKLYTDTIKQRFPNISVQGLSLYGFRQIATTKPINSYKDLSGLKMRSTGSKIHEEFYKSLGMVPVTVPWEENHTALFTGMTEGLHSPLGDILGSQLEGYIKYVYLDNSLIHSAIWMVSDTAMNQLPQDLREKVLVASDLARQHLKMSTLAYELSSIEMMKAKGVNFTKISDVDLANKTKYRDTVTTWFLDKYGEQAQNLLNEVQSSINTAESQVHYNKDLKHLK